MQAFIEYADITKIGDQPYKWCRMGAIEIENNIDNRKLIAMAKASVGAFGRFRTVYSNKNFQHLRERGKNRSIFINFSN